MNDIPSILFLAEQHKECERIGRAAIYKMEGKMIYMSVAKDIIQDTFVELILWLKKHPEFMFEDKSHLTRMMYGFTRNCVHREIRRCSYTQKEKLAFHKNTPSYTSITNDGTHHIEYIGGEIISPFTLLAEREFNTIVEIYKNTNPKTSPEFVEGVLGLNKQGYKLQEISDILSSTPRRVREVTSTILCLFKRSQGMETRRKRRLKFRKASENFILSQQNRRKRERAATP
jgi:hypothetical protein